MGGTQETYGLLYCSHCKRGKVVAMTTRRERDLDQDSAPNNGLED